MAKTTKAKEPVIKDVEVYWAEDDIEKVQLKPNLYIQQYGSAGCNHIGREIAQNGYDENIDESSPGSKVTIIIDTLSDKMTVKDDGRGFPEKKYPLDIFCTKIQSGSKSNRSQSGGTAGEFGVGMTVTNALASEFMIRTYRKEEKYIHTVTFKNGKKVDDKMEPNPRGLHGSEVSFVPNRKYLGKDAHIDAKAFYDWVVAISYLLGSEKKHITTYFEEWHGLRNIRREKIEAKPFSELMKLVCKKPAMEQVDVHKRGFIMESAGPNEKPVKKNVLLEVSFVYDLVNKPDEPLVIDSYCNYTHTTDGGTHESTVDEVICRYLQSEVKASLSDREKEKLEILWQDVRTDLRVCVNVTSDAQVSFMGNQKTKIRNEALIPVFKELLNEGISEFFSKNKEILSAMIKMVKSNAKARIELTKIKSVNTRIKTNNMDDHLDANFTPCNNRGKQYKELYLVEGQRSAAGSVVNARNPDVQAVLGFRGVTANAYKRDITNIFDNLEWKNYCNKIRYDIKAGNVNDVYYDKIIESTDADSDGFGISAGINAFHAKFARPIVEHGLLYKVYPPLYLIDDKKNPFMRNKKELIDYFMDRLLANFTVELKTKGPLKKADFRTFIYDTEYYLNELSLIADHYFVSRTLVEIIGFNLTMYSFVKTKAPCTPETFAKAWADQKFVTKLMNELQKFYPEVRLVANTTIGGIIDGSYQAIKITPKFMTKMKILEPVFLQYGIYCTFTDRGGKEIKSTIGELLTAATKYSPKILDRYKGLGEANWQDLANTIMDPSKRILIQLTLDDVDRDLKIIELLHAGSTEARKARKIMMRDYIITRDEIDN